MNRTLVFRLSSSRYARTISPDFEWKPLRPYLIMHDSVVIADAIIMHIYFLAHLFYSVSCNVRVLYVGSRCSKFHIVHLNKFEIR